MTEKVVFYPKKCLLKQIIDQEFVSAIIFSLVFYCNQGNIIQKG